MKTKSLHYIKVGLASAAFFGIVAIAFAAPTTWTAPTAAAPGADVAAPVNISTMAQIKPGMLDVTGFNNWGASYFSGSVQIASGSPATGKVLTSTDALGHTAWETPGTGGTSSSYWTASGANILNSNTGNVVVGSPDTSLISSYKLLVGSSSSVVPLGLQNSGSAIWNVGPTGATAPFAIQARGTSSPALTATSGGAVAVPGSLTVGGQNVCEQNGTNCPSAGSTASIPLYMIVDAPVGDGSGMVCSRLFVALPGTSHYLQVADTSSVNQDGGTTAHGWTPSSSSQNYGPGTLTTAEYCGGNSGGYVWANQLVGHLTP